MIFSKANSSKDFFAEVVGVEIALCNDHCATQKKPGTGCGLGPSDFRILSISGVGLALSCGVDGGETKDLGSVVDDKESFCGVDDEVPGFCADKVGVLDFGEFVGVGKIVVAVAAAVVVVVVAVAAAAVVVVVVEDVSFVDS